MIPGSPALVARSDAYLSLRLRRSARSFMIRTSSPSRKRLVQREIWTFQRYYVKSFIIRRTTDSCGGGLRHRHGVIGLALGIPFGQTDALHFLVCVANAPRGFAATDSRSRQFDEAFELPDAGGVAHFPQCLGLDLADALAGDLELAADFLERAAVAVLEAEALAARRLLSAGGP